MHMIIQEMWKYTYWLCPWIPQYYHENAFTAWNNKVDRSPSGHQATFDNLGRNITLADSIQAGVDRERGFLKIVLM